MTFGSSAHRADIINGLEQWFLKLSMYKSYPVSLLKHRRLGPRLGAWKSAFLTSAQLMPMLMARDYILEARGVLFLIGASESFATLSSRQLAISIFFSLNIKEYPYVMGRLRNDPNTSGKISDNFSKISVYDSEHFYWLETLVFQKLLL